jgi:hypothetical protein
MKKWFEKFLHSSSGVTPIINEDKGENAFEYDDEEGDDERIISL